MTLRSHPTSLPRARAGLPPEPRRGRLLLGLLDALLRLAEKPTSLGELALALGATATETGEALVTLERRGLVHVERLRLTLTGLAAASALRGASEDRRARAAERLAA